MSNAWLGVEAGAVPLDRIHSLVVVKEAGGTFAIRANLKADPLTTKTNPGLVVAGGFRSNESVSDCLENLLARLGCNLIEPNLEV